MCTLFSCFPQQRTMNSTPPTAEDLMLPGTTNAWCSIGIAICLPPYQGTGDREQGTGKPKHGATDFRRYSQIRTIEPRINADQRESNQLINHKGHEVLKRRLCSFASSPVTCRRSAVADSLFPFPCLLVCFAFDFANY